MAPALLPLLRAPPFPGPLVTLGVAGSTTSSAPPTTIDELFAALRDGRVGGAFWARPADRGGRTLLIRTNGRAEVEEILAGLNAKERRDALWVLPARLGRVARRSGLAAVIADEVDPWSLLGPDTRLLAHGDDEWAALALIAGCPVRFLSAGRYGAPGMTPDACRRYVADALLGTRYRDPFTGDAVEIDAIIAQLAHWRRIIDANRDIVAACGMAWWKRHEIARFLWSPGARLRFFRSERRALNHAVRVGGAVAVWPSRISPALIRRAEAEGVPLVRVEDGFVRSIGLGSNLVPPSSVTVDWLGIHYDPGHPSDLEALLADANFPPELLERAARLRAVIVKARISKYGASGTHAFPSRIPGRRLVLVPGQVEDDMSVRLGGGGLSSNLELLRRARALEPASEIWFRPHPDVDAGHRRGAVDDAEALSVADRVVRGGAMADLLALVDGVHVLTSLTGFEALLRGRDVTCHGIPFYAGWGLTHDLMPVPDRRGRALTLDQLVAGTLILYPRYLDPVTGLPCEPETLVARLATGAGGNRLDWVTRVRQFQGRLAKRWWA